MLLNLARRIARCPGPFTSITMIMRPGDGSAERACQLRRSVHGAVRAGAPQRDIAAFVGLLTGAPQEGRGGTRIILVRDGAIECDRLLPDRCGGDSQTFGPAADLTPLLRVARWPVPYVVIDVTVAGVNIAMADGDGLVTDCVISDSQPELLAARIDHLVAAAKPSVVFFGGEKCAAARLALYLSPAVMTAIVQQNRDDSWAAAGSTARQRRIDAVLLARMRRNRDVVVEQFLNADTRHIRTVSGLENVVSAVRRHSVERVLIHDDPTSVATLWVGADASQIAVRRAELLAMGVRSPVRVRAGLALARAVLATGRDVVLVDCDVALPDGVAAIRCWSELADRTDLVTTLRNKGYPAARREYAAQV